jgi:hypothetical protein
VWSLADSARVLRFILVEIFVLHLLEFQFHLEFFNIGLVEVFGDMFNVLVQLFQISLNFFEILFEIL